MTSLPQGKRMGNPSNENVYIDEYGQIISKKEPKVLSKGLSCPYCQIMVESMYCPKCGLDLNSKTAIDKKDKDAQFYSGFPTFTPDLPDILPINRAHTLATRALFLGIGSLGVWFVSVFFLYLMVIPATIGLVMAIFSIAIGFKARKMGQNHPNAGGNRALGGIICGFIGAALNGIWVFFGIALLFIWLGA